MAPGASGNSAIRARGLTRRFGRHLALDRVDLDVPAGTTYGLLGENGAGKTTFIRLVTGFLLPSAGDVEVFGVSTAAQPAAVQKKIGFVIKKVAVLYLAASALAAKIWLPQQKNVRLS